MPAHGSGPMVRYSIVVDLHHLLLAAHLCENAGAYRTPFDRRASRKSHRIEKDWPSVDRQSAGRRDGARSASLRQRGHWGIEIMHRNKDAILGEDCYNNRSGNAPRNIFSLIGIALNILKSAPPSPTRPFACSQVDPPRLLLNRPDMLILSMTMDRTDVIDGYGN
jgi:hypothetical protein